MDHETLKNKINQWYELYSNDIYQYIFFMIGDDDKAKDLMHDTFLLAYDNIDSLQWGNGKGWLFRIARNRTIDMIRKEKPIIYLGDTERAHTNHTTSPEEIFQFTETERELYAALRKLKQPYRDVIILRKIKEFTIEETAEILAWNEGKVKYTLFRGMKALKKQLLKEGINDESI